MSAILEMATSSTDLGDLVERLEGFGVDVPRMADWKRVREIADSGLPKPQPPADLLSATAEDIVAYGREVVLAAANAGRNVYANEAMRQVRGDIDQAMRASIRENASSIIAQLRATFDPAADGIREALAAGVKWDDTIESLFTAPDARREAWLATHTHARVLDDVLEVRQLLTYVADVYPSMSNLTHTERQTIRRNGSDDEVFNWGAVVSQTRSLAPRDRRAPWQRWLRIGADLTLIDPAGLTNFDSLQARRGGRALAARLKARANALARAEAGAAQ